MLTKEFCVQCWRETLGKADAWTRADDALWWKRGLVRCPHADACDHRHAHPTFTSLRVVDKPPEHCKFAVEHAMEDDHYKRTVKKVAGTFKKVQKPC